MRDQLSLVRGAVSATDMVPVLSHVAIHEGRIHGFNGRLHISAALPKEYDEQFLSFTAPLDSFSAAVDACGDSVSIGTKESADYIVVANRDFAARIPIGKVDAFPMPHLDDMGGTIVLNNFLYTLKALQPFIGQDASRPWASSIKFSSDVAIATNNVILVEASLDALMPTFCLPVYTVNEMLRLGREPLSMKVSEKAVLFEYEKGLWLYSALVHDEWPDAHDLLSKTHEGANFQKVATIKATRAVENIKPLCPDVKNPLIIMEPNQVKTQDGVTQASTGGLTGLGSGTFHVEPLLQVLRLNTLECDWSRFPRVPFKATTKEGALLYGILLGVLLR